MERDYVTPITLGALGVLLAGVIGLMAYAIHHEATEPTSGTVTSVEHQPAHTTVTCTTSGKTTTCVPVTTPECYRIEYDNGSDRGDACVSHEHFPLYHVGDHYPKEF